jgi:hypothetical protein
MYERCVGAVLEQPPHEIRQQLLVGADRRIDPNRRQPWCIGAHRVVKRLAHAVQALELVDRAAGRHREHRGDGQRVVCGELRVDDIARGKQLQRAGEIARIRRGLRGIHGKAVEAALLRALDLRIPIGALDQPHGHLPAALPGELRDPVQHPGCPPAVSLNGEPQAVPPVSVGIVRQRLDDVEGEIEPVSLLGIDGQADAGRAGAARQTAHPGSEAFHYPAMLGQ